MCRPLPRFTCQTSLGLLLAGGATAQSKAGAERWLLGQCWLFCSQEVWGWPAGLWASRALWSSSPDQSVNAFF